MRAAVCLAALLLGLCLIGCRRNYNPVQIRVFGEGVSRSVPGALVNRDFFSSSGVRPYLGRFFTEEDFQAHQPTVAVVSYRLWQDAFHSRPEIIGSTIQLDGRPTIIVGVAEPNFAPSGAGELWIPKP